MKNFLILLLFVGGYTAWYMYDQKKNILEGLESAQVQYDQLEKSVSGRRAEYQAAKKVVTIKQRLAEQKAGLAGLQKKLQAVQLAQNNQVKERQNTLAAIRQRFVGQTLPVVLASGRDLGQVRIMSMNEGGLSVATTSGIVKILPNDLPQALQVQFFYAY